MKIMNNENDNNDNEMNEIMKWASRNNNEDE